MYIIFNQVHHYLSWVVFLVAIYVIARSWVGVISKNAWTSADSKGSLIFSILADVQALIGIVLYVFLSPLTKVAFSDFGAAMKDSMLRFYAVEHILVMLIALALIHIGKAKAKKAKTDASKHKFSAIFFTIAFILILSRIPWEKLLNF